MTGTPETRQRQSSLRVYHHGQGAGVAVGLDMPAGDTHQFPASDTGVSVGLSRGRLAVFTEAIRKWSLSGVGSGKLWLYG